jgi:hypothetical protein
MRKYSLIVLLSCTLAVVSLPSVRAQGGGLAGRTVTGTVYFMSGRASGRSLPFRLIITRLTPPEQITELNSALQSGGQDDLLKALSRMDAGRISIGSGVGVQANAIIATPSGDGTKVIVLYERTLGFSELRYGTRRSDYRVGYAELYLGPGANQGMLIPAAKVRLKEGNAWEVEDFGTFPARLIGLQIRGGRNSAH